MVHLIGNCPSAPLAYLVRSHQYEGADGRPLL